MTKYKVWLVALTSVDVEVETEEEAEKLALSEVCDRCDGYEWMVDETTIIEE